jgi:hypothetical protein
MYFIWYMLDGMDYPASNRPRCWHLEGVSANYMDLRSRLQVEFALAVSLPVQFSKDID